MTAKKYKEFTISKFSDERWWRIFKGEEFIARTPNEEEARRVIFLNTNQEKYITDSDMEAVNA